MDKKLDNPKAYFEEVVKVSYEQFFNNPSSFANAFFMSSSLFHLHEWLYEFKKQEIEHIENTTFSSKGKYWQFIEGKVQEAKYIRDLTNASKHVRIGGSHFTPSTSITHIANTFIQTTGYGVGSYGSGRYGGGNVKLEDQGNEISLDDCAKSLFKYWEGIISSLYPA